MLRPLLHMLLRTVWPEPCLACGEDVASGGRLGLCGGCARKLRHAEPGCELCGRPLGDGRHGLEAAGLDDGHCCGSCRREPPPWRRLTFVWRYQPPCDAVVTALKFRRLDYLARRLGGPLAAALEPRRDALDAVVPVPLHWSRRLRRGYDQAELIAAEIAARLDLPLLRALKRRRATPPQSRHADRGRRRANIRAAFALRRRLAGLRLLLVDDVVTTGATLEAASTALLEAGAASVEVATAARTPEPGEVETSTGTDDGE